MKAIAVKNDAIRKHIPHVSPPHQLVLTAAVAALAKEELHELIIAVREFNVFTSDNDPYREHDLGKIILKDQEYIWKFDYYDDDFEYHREDGNRVLTIMASHEY